MNILSLLLGSAAALAAISGARAADAVAGAEPESAEYVKICDVYGAGYFFIPGTETCLRIGGYIRYDAGVGDIGSFDGAQATDHQDGGINGTWKNNARLSLKTWTGQETELGTLKTYTETRFNFGNTAKSGIVTADPTDPEGVYNKPVTLNFAWIQLGGLRVGKDETAFDTFIGYAGSLVQDAIIPFGGYDTNVIQYYFDAGNGFTAVASVETGSGADQSIDSYVPFVVGGVKYKGDWGAITAVGAYNSTSEEWAGKARLDVKPITDLTLFVMAGYGSDDNVAKNFYKPWTGNFAVWGGGSYAVNKKASLNAQISYTDDKDFAVAANVAYTIVPGYTITAEVDYYDNLDADDADAIGGILRFQRSF
ncbi:porin [Mesorhizobium sp. M0815]|uniref:porin n=1 Tax=Mesorhizobium sp. M0815 TaxID=2957005 RepID=UPI00333B7DA5